MYLERNKNKDINNHFSLYQFCFTTNFAGRFTAIKTNTVDYILYLNYLEPFPTFLCF